MSSDAPWERALAVMPGGVNSPVRSFRSVGSPPFFVARLLDAIEAEVCEELGA